MITTALGMVGSVLLADFLSGTELHPDWRVASVVRKELLPQAAQDCIATGAYPFSFEIMADLNHDGRVERSLVGVFEEESGQSGTFLLILQQRRGGRWKKAFLATVTGRPTVSDIGVGGSLNGSDQSSVLFWMHCSECDTGAYIRWSGKKYLAWWTTVEGEEPFSSEAMISY